MMKWININSFMDSETYCKYRLGVVTPLANEEKTIDEFLARALRQLGENDRIFCVIDNASKDSTREKIAQYAQNDKRVLLVWAPENRSAVDAYFRGYQEALNADCKWILEMDGGLSHQPEEIPRFIEAMQSGVDFAGGSRFIKGSKYIRPRIRYVISRGGTILTNVLLGTKMRDMTSGFECFTQKALRHVLNKGVKSRAHFFQTEIRFMMHNFKWVEVPISYRDPSKSVNGNSIKEAFKNLWELRKQK